MKIGIVGVGNMGNAFYKLFVRNGYKNIILSDIKNYPNVSRREAIENCHIVFLCTKPREILGILEGVDLKNKLIISTAAAVEISDIRQNHENKVIRVMSNLGIEYGKGNITYCTTDNLSINDLENFYSLCKGPKLIKIGDEKLLDVITLLSGSMPAFISYFADEYIDFAVKNGLNKYDAKEIYLTTMEATVTMLKEKTPREVMKNVSSPQGITMQGIQYMENTGVRTNIRRSLNYCLENIVRLKN